MSTQLLYEDDEKGLFTNKSVVMANFEEWIKMATDNKINTRNSWNFALIDYFHDLNVLKDAEQNINFQKASATLDGCVKIYSSRVDSAANETGKLLSGLAERRANISERAVGSKKDINDADEVEIDSVTGLPNIKDGIDSEKRKRTYNRVLETTLVEFESIRMKELDQELIVDPMFKKALADFDEGGAKSLLINTLNVDKNLRVVFDATSKESDFAEKLHDERNLYRGFESVSTEASREEISQQIEEEKDNSHVEHEENGQNEDSQQLKDPSVDDNLQPDEDMCSFLIEDEILALGMAHLSFDCIQSLEVCPSVRQLQAAVADSTTARGFIDDINNKFDNFLTEQDMQEAMPDGLCKGDIQDYDYDLPGQVDDKVFNEDDEINNSKGEGSLLEDNELLFNTVTGMTDKELLLYFDDAFKNSWRGRDHWKIHNYKHRLNKDIKNQNNSATGAIQNIKKSKKIQKDVIDFFDLDTNIEETIFAAKKTSTELAQKHREYFHHHLLPNDYQFTIDRITKLFIKPDQRMRFLANKNRKPSTHLTEAELSNNSRALEIADENFWADTYKLREEKLDSADKNQNTYANSDDKGVAQDLAFDDQGDIDFNQLFEEHGTPGLEEEDQLDVPFMQNLLKTEDKVTYSRTVKKVDIRRLKKNIWKAITKRIEHEKNQIVETNSLQQEHADDIHIDLRFNDITNDITSIYPENKLKDLSTSFCFICLLHLANEHGFTITNENNYDDLLITFTN